MKIIRLDTVDSTNTHAKSLARDGASSWTVVTAGEQTAGRGRRGNGWVSVPGNLYASFILRPQKPAAEAGQLSFVAAAALADAMAQVLAPETDVALKWPNDALIDGRKAAGILLESETLAGEVLPAWVVVGIGVNIAGAPEGAASLRTAGAAAEVDASTFLDILGASFQKLYGQWQDEGFAPLRALWMSRAAFLGQEISVRLPNETFSGVFRGLEHNGALNVELPGGEVRLISSGEVYQS